MHHSRSEPDPYAMLTLAHRIQLQIGLAIALVIVAVTGAGYVQTLGSMRDEAVDNLRSTTHTRAALESASFLQAQENTLALRKEYLHRLDELGTSDPKAEFDKWFVRYPDGLIRVRPELDNHKRLPSIYIRPQIALDAELRREVVVAFQLLREWGPAQTLRYFSAYIDLPGKSLIMFSPSVNWGKEADTSTNNFDYPPVQNSAPDKNPRRDTLWTDVYLDDKAKAWMLSVITPIDQRRWVGTASQDIAVDDLIQRTTNDYAPGTFNLVMDRKGHLVAHPVLMEKIRQSAGNLDIKTLGDPQLSAIFEQVSLSGSGDDVRQTADGNYYLGISHISGPNWYFVTVYPKALLERKGAESARTILFAGLAGLLLELALLAWVIRRQIAAPLRALSQAAQSVAQGNMQVDLPVRGKGELATLADSFTSMLDKLRQRDTALQSRATELEQEVQKRQNTEATLERSEAYKEAMLHTIPDLVFVKDPHGAFVIANLAFEAVYGRSIAEISGKTDFDFLPVELAAYFAQRDQMAIDAGGPTISEAWQHNYKTGEETLYETIKTPIYANDGAVLGLLGIGRDITERRRAQDALQALNDELEARVTLRTQALEKANTELQSAMDMLRTTQNELVQGEKLASLGRMVAGLAHELIPPSATP